MITIDLKQGVARNIYNNIFPIISKSVILMLSEMCAPIFNKTNLTVFYNNNHSLNLNSTITLKTTFPSKIISNTHKKR
jgi:hypothetical protein